MTLALSGYPVVDGIAVGQTHIIRRNELNIGEYRIDADATDDEVQRLGAALNTAASHLEQLAERIRNTAGRGAEDIIRTHIAMLCDPTLADTAAGHIRDKLCNAEWALQLYLEAFLAELDAIDDPYIRSRGEDLAQVVQLAQEILAEEPERPLTGLPDRLGETLVIASELTPGELAVLHERGVAGLITEHGSPHSHTAILARSLGIPTVMGVHHGRSLIREGEALILDGHYGVVFASPEESILKHYLHKQARSDRFIRSLEGVRERPCESLDGVQVCLRANAERDDDLAVAIASGADGVGLFRTEFLFLKGTAPDEEAQYQRYRAALEACGGHCLTIRTLDLGADKGADLLDFHDLRSRPNPALGLRAVRLCLRELDLFKSQLKAILRTSAHGTVHCLIPMLTSAGEVRAVRGLLAEVRAELDAAGHTYDPEMRLGGMIEVPAAALALESLCRELDFLSVGTNDLIQYALATDRVDEQVAHLYDPQHPGVVHLLLHIFRSAAALEIPVAVCGELAGDRRFTRLLLALGLTEFSMQPRSLLEVKQVITETDVAVARDSLQAWLDGHDETSLLHHLDRAQTR
ncbi:MAG: phosphoenolpyruvate--protein phosphotransferase [Xanthomonadales bacterium]|nr:phosphoenolpyruvate--protein phosphotransferase [Xanthomonadales bacterium]